MADWSDAGSDAALCRASLLSQYILEIVWFLLSPFKGGSRVPFEEVLDLQRYQLHPGSALSNHGDACGVQQPELNFQVGRQDHRFASWALYMQYFVIRVDQSHHQCRTPVEVFSNFDISYLLITYTRHVSQRHSIQSLFNPKVAAHYHGSTFMSVVSGSPNMRA